ncbi:MAG: aspartyl/glutamyl-tRNA(Asn/Gln) amidotransferase subunit [Candidatus Saccharibacteria bacterium]|nr:aspartyl/glutamyl-tRNA(Asn/Gln) amidotransferase subunit [Candidatus Saccharibacteria bacterium]
MISPELRAKYTPTIGIECHVQLKTKTKLFSAVGNDAREAPPNTLVSHIDFGLPGALPVLNKQAVQLAARAAFALNSTPQLFSKFDRKHYFYPDLPMGYQITQYDEPIVLGGSVEIVVDGVHKTIGITRAHLEADAGKSVHPVNADFSLVDLNRAGTPLLEIVSEPDMHSAAEAKAYARELFLRMRYADVSDADLYYGNMRFDVNVSVSTTDQMGTRSETKNLNSFRSVEKAIEYEIDRQIEAIERGEAILQETRGWDDAKLKTISQRTKENADDYRYMPDPDLPPVIFTAEEVAAIKAQMGVTVEELRNKIHGLGASESLTEAILDQPPLVDILLATEKLLVDAGQMDRPNLGVQVTNWVGQLIPNIAEEASKAIDELQIVPQALIDLSIMYDEAKVSSTQAKAILKEVVLHGANPAAYAEEAGLMQESDEGAITAIVDQVIAENPKAAEDVKNGEMKAIGFLTGQVMKASQGKANPALATQLIKRQLGI